MGNGAAADVRDIANLGIAMRPEQIQQLMHLLNAPKLAETDPETNPGGDKPRAGEPPAR